MKAAAHGCCFADEFISLYVTCLPSFVDICCWGSIWQKVIIAWWRHQMETLSALLGLSAGKFTGWIPLTRPVTRCFHVFFNLRLNNRMNKQSRRRRLETPSRSLWRILLKFDGLCSFYNYADDNSIGTSHSNAFIFKTWLEKYTEIAIEWLEKDHMQAKASKFQAIVIKLGQAMFVWILMCHTNC